MKPLPIQTKKRAKSGFFSLLLLIVIFRGYGQTASLPVTVLPTSADTTKPMIFYISGDGGWNKFSKALAETFSAKGYPVVALNAKDYFWKKKTVAQAVMDISPLIRGYANSWKRHKIVLIGYSFGADVLPFIFNQLPADIVPHVINISLLSPSQFTDFEIHLSVMMGGGLSKGESVVGAVNKIAAKPLTLIFGKGENDFPISQLKIKNYTAIILDGGHHYDGDEEKVCETLLAHLPKN